jgi:pilus assembly protein CpaE
MKFHRAWEETEVAIEQLRVLIVEDSVLTASVLREMVDTQPDLTAVDVAMTGQDGIRRASELYPDVVLMDIHLPDIDGLNATWEIATKSPDSAIIMVTSEDRSEYMQQAMLAGAQGYVVKPVRDPEQLANTIRTVHERAVHRRALYTKSGAVSTSRGAAPLQLGRRVAVFSPKGGQGKTTIAVNLAIALRVLTEKRVMLMDTDLAFGDSNLMLDIPFERSIIDLLPSIDHIDSDLLDQVVSTHATGVQVLMRPERPELADIITLDHLGQVLTMLPRLYDYIVIDCETSYDDKALAVLDRADSILVVLTLDLGAMHNAKNFLQLADRLGYARRKIDFVLNRTNARVALNPADIEQALGPGRYFRVDSQPQTIATGCNLGKPAVLSQPRSQFTREILNIANHISSGNGAS